MEYRKEEEKHLDKNAFFIGPATKAFTPYPHPWAISGPLIFFFFSCLKLLANSSDKQIILSLMAGPLKIMFCGFTKSVRFFSPNILGIINNLELFHCPFEWGSWKDLELCHLIKFQKLSWRLKYTLFYLNWPMVKFSFQFQKKYMSQKIV